MKLYASLFWLLCGFSVSLSNCTTETPEASQQQELVTRYWLAGERVACTENPGTACFQVQQNDTLTAGAWEQFPYAIAGLNYEPGYLYHVRLQNTDDTSYTLVELINRTPDVRFALSKKFVLLQLNGQNYVTHPNHTTPTLSIDFDSGKISGSDGCNQFMGNGAVSRGGDFSMAEFTSTVASCEPLQPTLDYMAALNIAKRFDVRGDRLLLRDLSGRVALRFVAEK